MALWNFGKTSASEEATTPEVGNGVSASARESEVWQRAREGFFECAPGGAFCAVNPALARCFGHETPAAFLATSPSIFASGLFANTAAGEDLLQKLRANNALNDYEIQINHQDGTQVWTSWSIWPHGENGAEGWGGSVSDISREKTAEERLLRHAWHDRTTGLADRNLFVERIGALLKRAANRENSNQPQFAVVFLDLDRFKVVNDTLGHNAGDQLLIGIARRLEAVLRPNDLLARLGGDEFGILLDDISDIKDVTPQLERLQKRLTMSLTIEGQEVYSNASIGVALGRRDDRVETLLRNAEAAMYRAKEKGRARYEVWQGGDKTPRDSGAMKLESDLRRAVERQEFRCFYQPLVSLATGRVIGFESLVRWFHPTLGKNSSHPLHSYRRRYRLDQSNRPLGFARIVSSARDLAEARRAQFGFDYVGQLVGPTVHAARSGQAGRPHFADQRSRWRQSEIGSDRIGLDGRSRNRHQNSQTIQSLWHQTQSRRFRHRLFKFELSPSLSVQRLENRPIVRLADGRGGEK